MESEVNLACLICDGLSDETAIASAPTSPLLSEVDFACIICDPLWVETSALTELTSDSDFIKLTGSEIVSLGASALPEVYPVTCPDSCFCCGWLFTKGSAASVA